MFMCAKVSSQLLTKSRIFAKKSHNFATNSNSLARNCFELLNNRRLIKLTGTDTCNLLQGLITNDVSHLERVSSSSLFAMFLNAKGRILYDVILYRNNFANIANFNEIYLECDVEVVKPLIKHLTMYKLKKMITIEEIDDRVIGVIYDREIARRSFDRLQKRSDDAIDGYILPCSKGDEDTQNYLTIDEEVIVHKDPRLGDSCARVLAPKSCNLIEKLAKVYGNINVNCPKESYKWFRYSLGLGEGVEDLPMGNCFPLEANCDYLHGISFHKGCYIGQELTARTHHTGVVRKRYMPLYFKKVPTKLPEDFNILHNGKRLGKLHGVHENVGLALLHVNDAINCEEIRVGADGIAWTAKPNWWPKEVAKETLNALNRRE